jgi:hypothetical protein
MHSAPMLRKIAAIEPAAVGLWAVAGSWSSDHLTDGFIPDDDLPWLFPDAPRLAQALVTAGAWKRMRNGHRFVPDGVTHKIPTREAVETDRSSAAERQRRSRERKLSRRDSHVTDAVTNGVSHSALSNPSQSMADVSNLPGGSRESVSGDVIEAITQEIYDRTSRVVDAGWAAKIAGHILGDRPVRDPAGYCRKAIRKEPNPQVRFLPMYPETP